MLLLLMYGPPFNGPHAGPGHFPGFFFCGPVLFWSLLLGTLASLTLYLLYLAGIVPFNSDLEESFWGAGLAFVTAVVVAVAVTMFTPAKPENELRGLVYGLASNNPAEQILAADKVWWRNPVLLGTIAVVLAFVLYIPVW